MSRNLLPAGLVPQSRTAAYDALIGKSLEQERPLIDAKTAILQKGIDSHKGSITQQFIKDLRGVDTGNPLQDEQIRNEMNKNRPSNLYDDKVINPLMQTLKTEGATDYTSDLSLEKAIRGEDHRVWDETTMRTLNRSDPNYMTNLGDAVKHSAQYGINAPAVTAEATQAFTNTDIQFARNKNDNGVIISGDTVTNAVGDTANAKAWNTNAYKAAKRVSVNNMAKNNPHIRDRAVFEARFDKMITDHPEYGQKFKLGKADEAGMTIDTQTLEKYATEISDGVNNLDTVAGGKTVVSSLNNMLSYMSKNNIKNADYEDLVIRTLERDPLTSTDIFKNAGVADPENVKVISANQQAKAKKYVREHYRKTYPELTDSILTKAYDRIINSGSDNVSVAVGIGKTNAESSAKMRVDEAKFFHTTWAKNVKDLRVIQGDQGLVNHLTKKLESQFKENFKEQEFTSQDSRRLKTQVVNMIGKLETHIGKGLKGPEKNAFDLTAQRLVMNMSNWDENTKIFGMRVPEWMGGGADFGLLSGSPMSSQNTLKVMELFHANILDATTVRAAKKGEVKIKKGAELLKDTVNKKIAQAKANPKTDSMDLSIPGKIMNNAVMPEDKELLY